MALDKPPPPNACRPTAKQLENARKAQEQQRKDGLPLSTNQRKILKRARWDEKYGLPPPRPRVSGRQRAAFKAARAAAAEQGGTLEMAWEDGGAEGGGDATGVGSGEEERGRDDRGLEAVNGDDAGGVEATLAQRNAAVLGEDAGKAVGAEVHNSQHSLLTTTTVSGDETRKPKHAPNPKRLQKIRAKAAQRPSVQLSKREKRVLRAGNDPDSLPPKPRTQARAPLRVRRALQRSKSAAQLFNAISSLPQLAVPAEGGTGCMSLAKDEINHSDKPDRTSLDASSVDAERTISMDQYRTADDDSDWSPNPNAVISATRTTKDITLNALAEMTLWERAMVAAFQAGDDDTFQVQSGMILAKLHIILAAEDRLATQDPPARTNLLHEWIGRCMVGGTPRKSWLVPLLGVGVKLPRWDVEEELPVCTEHPYYDPVPGVPSGDGETDSVSGKDSDGGNGAGEAASRADTGGSRQEAGEGDDDGDDDDDDEVDITV